ncbi:MAG: hypothetical protein JWM53_2506 [bacterium]|nr:hypothetical protein [bacterium]
MLPLAISAPEGFLSASKPMARCHGLTNKTPYQTLPSAKLTMTLTAMASPFR